MAPYIYNLGSEWI